MRAFRLAAFLVLLSAVPCFGQSANVPTAPAGFVVTKEPVRDGVRSVADLPVSQHHRNTGGSDGPSGPGSGSGLCVYTSFWHSAIWQAVSEVYAFRDWMTRRPGGSYPEKFEKTLSDFCREKSIPIPGYVQHTGGEVEFLELALKTGRMVCVTYCGVDGEGRYGGEVVAHMVNLVHMDSTRAAILDNNFPGTWLWMSREAFVARWRGVQTDGRPFMARMGARWMPIGGGWAIVLVASPPAPYPAPPALVTADEERVCICGDACECEKNGKKCPAQCPVLTLIGQPKQPLTYAEVCERVKTGKRVTLSIGPTLKGKAEGHIDALPGFAVGIWDCFLLNGKPVMQLTCPDGQCPLKPKPRVDAVEVEAVPVQANEFPPNGVIPDRLTAGKHYFLNGEAVTREEAHAALSLTDDSQRWNVAIVGEPNFARKVRDDLGTLPADVRAKLHVQSYTPGDWPVSQFSLQPGVTLRKPAVGRVGADLGSVPIADYSAVRLADMLASDGGPTAKPKPAPPPRPKDPDAPKVDPVPEPMPKPVDPNGAASGGTILFMVALLAVLWFIIKK